MASASTSLGHRRITVDTEVGIDGEDPNRLVADRGILISDDGSRRSELLYNLSHKKRRVRLLPRDLDDSLAEWIPVDDLDYKYSGDVDAVSAVPTALRSSSKRKSYASSDDPMSLFPEVEQLFSDEILRRAGLGNWTMSPECALCQEAFDTRGGFTNCYRCADCGEFLQCRGCCLAHHASSPLHFLEAWTGSFWRKTPQATSYGPP
ncbi:hypothetical protein C8R47DRAFT_1261584 [Mycena vitilis]|nr:hypothetical protein C8R47DRAFT_1261584 [Mycena vitilis]